MSRIVYGLILWWLASSALAAGSVVELGAAPRQALGDVLGLFYDPSGQLDLAEVQTREFQPLPSSAPNLGIREGATWARFVLVNAGPKSEERWLNVIWTARQTYTLYLVDGEGHSQRLENGVSLPIAERPLASRRILFPIRLAPGERKTAYLRCAGGTATVLDVTLWQPVAYLDTLTGFIALKYLGLGTTVIVLVFSLLAWRVRRRHSLLAVGVGQILVILLAFWQDGFLMEWIPADTGFWYSRCGNALVFIALFCHVVFARGFLEIPDHSRRLDRGLFALAGLCWFLAILSLGWVSPWLSNLVIVLVGLLLTGAAVFSVRRRGVPGLWYLVAWGGVWLGVTVHSVQMLGWLPGTPFFSELYYLPLIGSGLVFGYALYRDVEAVRLEFDTTQARLLTQEQRESERLARAVDEGTAEMRAAMARAEAASQAKSAFLSMVSHELRTPLHTILGYANLLGKHAEGEMFEKLSIIEKSGGQLLHLIDEVLYYSRGESQPMVLATEPVNLRALAAYLENTGRLLAEKNYNRFVVELAPNLPETVETDEGRLTQVLLNLIGNACKYTEFGRISLRVAALDYDGETPPGWRRIYFEVEDNGVGIAEADQDHVFDPFSRGSGRDRQGGVGLGLTIARQIVRAMEGDIGLESGLGRGCRFYFTLSLKETEAESHEVPTETGRIVGYAGPRLTLLVVDDIPLNRKLLGDLCQAWNFDVVMAADGEEAAACCRDAESPIAAALVDQFMPRADGWAFLRTVRGSPNFAHLPLILVSATLPERPQDMPDGMDFDRVLAKPVTPDQLAETLRSVLKLEWLREAPPLRPLASGRCLPPPPEKLAEFRNMLALGQVLALRRWADALALSHPEYAEFAKQVGRLSQAIDLAGLRSLLDRVSAEAG